VCECKYERKIVERNEERIKWKERQQKLKALKKQSFMHIVDTSRPMIEDKKFIISDVKRIPRKDEKDDIKYCISGVAEEVSMSPPQKIIDGLKMSTPFQTPSSSEEDISRTAVVHRHWSPMNIPPGPLPRKNAVLKEEIERRKKARDEAFKLIYENKNEQNACWTTRNDQKAFDEQKLMTKVDKNKDDTMESYTNIKKETSKGIIELQSLSKRISSKIRDQRDVLHKEIPSKVIRKSSEEIVGHQNVSHKQVIEIEKTREKINDGSSRINGIKKYINNKSNLTAIIKVFFCIFLI